MLCCSPYFTFCGAQKNAVDYEAKMIEVTRRMGGPGSYAAYSADSAILRSSRSKGLHGWSTAPQLLPVARECDVILGLENHYKDGF